MNALYLTLNLEGKLLNNRYYLSELIACKNYYQVYQARDIVKHRKCLVKRLTNSGDRSEFWQKTELIFQQEAAILQKLAGKHHRIGQLDDYFREDTSWYLIQEWIPGITLEQKLQLQGKLSESETKEILLDLLTLVECIHSWGIIHCNIKPQSIMLRSGDNLPVLNDFSTARQIGDRLQLNSIVKNPGHMSIEQTMEGVAARNDLYSLGLTAIHLLIGRSPLEIAGQERTIPASYSFSQILERAITSDPDRQFTSAREMRSALLDTLPPLSVSESNIVRSRWTRRLLSILAVQIAAAIYGGFYLATNLEVQPPVDLDEMVPPPVEREPKAIAPMVAEPNWEEIIFRIGTSEEEILQTLGEPVWRKPGYWSNSTAWLYENVATDGINMGYIFDRQTNKLRQVEISVPPDTPLSTVQSILDLLLFDKANSNAIEGLRSVDRRCQAIYNFTAGDLEGTIQCNHKNRIYIAVWMSGFH